MIALFSMFAGVSAVRYATTFLGGNEAGGISSLAVALAQGVSR
jgi:hypothetical protein